MSERLAGADGAPSDSLIRAYERWGRSGAGLLITGNVMVDATAVGETGNVIVEDTRDLPSLRAWASVARAHGAKAWMQLNHPGRQSPRFLSPAPVAPSVVPMRGSAGMFARPRALTDAEVQEIIARFGRTAEVARAAGFDGVQIHGAHGYLVNQFLSPRTNLRDDAWGGDAERRRRFLVEVVRAVRRAVGIDFSLGVKLNSADFQRGGFTEDESLDVISALETEGVNLLEVSGGTYESAAMFGESKRSSTVEREAFFIEYAARARARTRLPLMVTGGFRTRDGMNAALAGGALDLIGIARPFAVEPDLPSRLLDGAASGAQAVHLATGIASLDGLVQAAWYQAQNRRLGRGQEPKLNLGRFGATVGYLRGASNARARILEQRAASGAAVVA